MISNDTSDRNNIVEHTQIFSNIAVRAKPADRKKTPALALDDPWPASIMTMSRSGATKSNSQPVTLNSGNEMLLTIPVDLSIDLLACTRGYQPHEANLKAPKSVEISHDFAIRRLAIVPTTHTDAMEPVM